MTLSWLTERLDEYRTAYGIEPNFVQLGDKDFEGLFLDVSGGVPFGSFGWPQGAVTFGVNGISCEGGGNSGYAAFHGEVTTGYWYAPPAPKSLCDCGSAKTNQPGHSPWCSVQRVSA